MADAGAGAGEVTGSLTVSAPETLLTYRLPKLLAIFHERHPKVSSRCARRHRPVSG